MSGETSLDPTWSYGTVHVHGHRQGENGEIVDVRRTFHVVPAVGTIDTPCFVATAPVVVFDLEEVRGAH